MDKVRSALQWLVRHRFWVTCVLVSLVTLATWFMAWQSIEKKRSDRARILKQKKTSIENVINSSVATGVGDETINVHPNNATKAGMEGRIKEAGEAALLAWQARYEKQKAILQFPDVLPAHIREPLAAHEPMEKPIEVELLNQAQRETYKESITKRMPFISEIIKCQWTFDENGAPISDIDANADRRKKGKRNRDGSLTVAKDLVRWDKKNKELWNDKTTQFQGFNKNPDKQPTSQQTLALQQDLWILEGIFNSIAEVNKGFTANDLAPIERVDHVLVGTDAVNPELGRLMEFSYKPPSSSSSGSKKSSSAKSGSGGLKSKRERKKDKLRARAKAAKKGKSAVAFNMGESSSPFHGRYVDRDFTQLNESSITDAITSDELTDQSYLAVAKRVPVRIAVKMDERRINDFLAAAANSPFAFEIRQVRINKHEPMEGVERKASAVKQGGDKDKRGGLGIGGGSGGNSADGGPAGGGKGSDDDDAPFGSEVRTNFDIKIEFIGIVKIYNPVNRDLILRNKKNKTAADDDDE